MFTYATIFIASIILAVTALVIYRVVMGSSKSILSSKEPISIITNTPFPRNDRVPLAAAGSGQTSRVTPGRIAKTRPSVPSDNINRGWQAQGNQVGEHQPSYTTGGSNTRHCSLYDVDPVAPPKNRNAVWPHREEKLETNGKAYTVRRKVTPRTSNPEGAGKPWGW